ANCLLRSSPRKRGPRAANCGPWIPACAGMNGGERHILGVLPPPLWGRVGEGGCGDAPTLPYPITPTPNPSPQGGGEQTESAARGCFRRTRMPSRRQERAEAAGHDPRADARGVIDQALALEPGLEFRCRAALQEIAHGERVVERRALIAE